MFAGDDDAAQARGSVTPRGARALSRVNADNLEWFQRKNMPAAFRYCCLLLTVVCLARAAPLKLEDCVRLALAAPSSVRVARMQAEIARLGAVQARANFLPQGSLGNSFNYNSPLRGTPDAFSFVALNGVREYSSIGSMNMDIDISGRLRAIMARARADQAAAAASLAISERDLRRLVASSYYRAVLAKHVASATKASLDEARSFEDRARLLAEKGESARADVVKAGAEVAFLEQSLNAAELESKLAAHDLTAFWTADVDAAVELADSLDEPAPAPEGATPAATSFLARPEFRLFDAQRSGFEADARRAKADLLPQLSLVGQYGLDSLRLKWADRGYAGFVNLQIPIFDWFRARSAARQSHLQAEQVLVNRRVAEREFSRDYRDALARVELVYAQIGIAERQVRLSEENLKLSHIRYEGGEGTALDVVSAQSQLTQARTNYFTAKANYLNARADLEVAAGK
jgi:outer membrane protein TolC